MSIQIMDENYRCMKRHFLQTNDNIHVLFILDKYFDISYINKEYEIDT